MLMFELLCWMLSVPLEWLWQRRVEPVASISGHLRAALDFVGKSVERFSLLRMLIVPRRGSAPVVHQPPSALEQIRTGVGCFPDLIGLLHRNG